MADMTLEDRVSDNSAKITALIMVVESLLVESLAKDDDPARIGSAIVDSLWAAEQAATKKTANYTYAMRVSEAASSLIDRAVRRAVALRSKERPS
jgi:hypothetical protein